MASSSSATRSPPSQSAYDLSLQPAVLIMAAGTGSRLWPLSTKGRAKQFAALLRDDETMLQATVRRALMLTSADHLFVTVAPGMQAWVQAQCPVIPSQNIVVLPPGCDTLPGVALASALVEARLPGRMLALFAADNFVDDDPSFVRSCQEMLAVARHEGHLVSLGISPTYPAEIYGYMKMGPPSALAANAHWGLGYIEKPSASVASQLVANGDCLWNSGIFAWRPDNFFSSLLSVDESLHHVTVGLRAAAQRDDWQGMHEMLLALPNISLDHGLMEKLGAATGANESRHIFVRASFEWDDIGSYKSLKARLKTDDQGVTIRGDVAASCCHNSLLFNAAAGRLCATGLDDYVVAIGSQQEILVARLDQVGLLRTRLPSALHPGASRFADMPSPSQWDAAHNTCDAPVAFVASSHCHVRGAQGREVVLLGAHHLEISITEQNVVVQRRTGAARAQATPSPALPLRLTLLPGAADVAEAVAHQLVQDIRVALEGVLRPSIVLSAGATPLGVYKLLATRYQTALPWPRVRLLQMDAYSGLSPDDPAHFHHMLQKMLVEPLGLSARFLRGSETVQEMQDYAQEIEQTGGIDVILHGIGRNGHLGFNEPGAAFDSPSGRVELAPATRLDFAQANPRAQIVPSHGVTLGLHLLNGARRVRVMALGKAKQDALVTGLVTAPSRGVPLSSLQTHADVAFFADRDAWLTRW